MEQLRTQIECYSEQNVDEKSAKEALLDLLDKYGDNMLKRNPYGHITVAAIVLNQNASALLMVYHNIYQSFAWPGGHSDEEKDLLKKIMEEVKEETGLVDLQPLSGGMISLDALPVKAHIKNGEPVEAHLHYNATFALIASDRQTLAIKEDENTQVAWIGLDEWRTVCQEKHMISIYEKVIIRSLKLQEEKERIYTELSVRLLPWYEKNARALPWRNTKDPYKIWISEIMLQQTRVEAVKDYYDRFLQTLPSISDLANASEEVLLKLWEGLGYYSRVKNLQKSAKIIVEEYDGVFPEKYEQIRALPGIGDYTAAAIASYCFGKEIAAVDGNVLRVVCRAGEDYSDITKQATKKTIGEKLTKVYPTGENKENFNQSLMELGATVCLPNGTPRCNICPLNEICMANKNRVWHTLPRKAKKKPRKREEKTVFLFFCNGKIAVEKRREKGLLAGLWQFPNVTGAYKVQDALDLMKEWDIEPISVEKEILGEHIFTHIEWSMRCFYVVCKKMNERFVWLEREEIEKKIPLPSAFRQFLEQ